MLLLQSPHSFYYLTMSLLLNCQIFPIVFPTTVARSHSESESDYSASNSEDDEGVAQDDEEDTNKVILSSKIQAQNRVVSAPVCKETPSKKMKRDETVSEDRDLNLQEKLCSISKIWYPKRRDPNGEITIIVFLHFSIFCQPLTLIPMYVIFWTFCLGCLYPYLCNNTVIHVEGDILIQL